MVNNNIDVLFSKENPKILSQSFWYSSSLFLNYSIHFPISVLKAFNFFPRYFFSFEILDNFKTINKNRLKNIFSKNKYFFDVLWLEIEKMLISGFIGFSKIYFYRGQNTVNLLVEFLLEVFLNSLKFYFLLIEKNYTSKKYMLLTPTFTFDKFTLLNKKSLLIPLKLHNDLKNVFTLKNFSLKKLKHIESHYIGEKYLTAMVFERRIKFIRHKYQVLVSFLGSKKLVLFIKSKIVKFLRSNLNITTKFFNLLDGVSENIFFLGFNIRFSLKINKNSNINLFKSNKKYLSKIFLKLDSLKRETARATLDRIYAELFDLVNKSSFSHKLKLYLRKKNYIWALIFQLEAIRSTQYNKLLLTRDKKDVISNELISSYTVGIKSYSRTAKYFFSLFSNKLQFVLMHLIQKITPFVKDSMLCFDLGLSFLFMEFRKKLFLLYNTSYKSLNFEKNCKDLLKKELKLMKLSSYYNISFSQTDLFYLRDLNFPQKSFISRSRRKRLDIFLSFDFCLSKLKLLGFIHPFKNRPISNSKYLTLEDFIIVKRFGWIAFNHLNWFHCVSNMLDLKKIIALLRQSCFLTLCRKHNKHKTWAFDIYTIDLLTIENLCFHSIHFPTKQFLSKLKRKFFIYQSYVRLDEKFFL